MDQCLRLSKNWEWNSPQKMNNTLFIDMSIKNTTQQSWKFKTELNGYKLGEQRANIIF